MIAAAQLSLQLAVSDLTTTEAFYAGILEVDVRRALSWPGAMEYLVMKQGAWELVFVEEQAVVRAHPALEERFDIFPQGVGLTLHFKVREIEEIYDALLEEEIEILYPLEKKPYGMKELWCFDPDGYLLVLEEPWR